jgi:hypothetical protein
MGKWDVRIAGLLWRTGCGSQHLIPKWQLTEAGFVILARFALQASVKY